jgi:ubiquinone/menaquinone biosynthesis C-methylase UbiE
VGTSRSAPLGDAYLRYIQGFFGTWSPYYDLFAAPIAFAYAAVVRSTGARPGRRILDVCTGTGEVALRAARAGANVTAIDVSPAMLSRARRKRGGSRVSWAEMDARKLGFAHGAFDISVLSFALHDMPQRVRGEVLAEAQRVSREGVVVLDYEIDPDSTGGRCALAILSTFETAYLRGFAKLGGSGAIESAGLQSELVGRPIPGLLALRRIPGPPRGPLETDS